ncbi:YihY/virulence factor BrkB family protein [Okibacterium endophyticum]
MAKKADTTQKADGPKNAAGSAVPSASAPVKANSPTGIRRASWFAVFKRAIREFGKDEAVDVAAALTYYAVLAMFPALLAIVSLLALVGQDENVIDGMLELFGALAPEATVDTLRGPLTELTAAPGAGLAFVIGLGGAIWSASGYVRSFSRGMNRIYRVQEGRPFFRLQPVILTITVFAIALLTVMALLLIVTGPIAEAVGSLIGLGETALLVWNIAKWPVLVLLAVIIIAVLYYFTPNIKQPRFRWVSVGAAVALLVWALATTGFFFYAANFSNYDETYGSLGGVIIFLLWLYLSNMALLFGAEIDSELERVRELQAGIKAEYTVQLPLRHTSQIDKNIEAEAAAVLEARNLRLSSGHNRG